jgi:hypothetical protein
MFWSKRTEALQTIMPKQIKMSSSTVIDLAIMQNKLKCHRVQSSATISLKPRTVISQPIANLPTILLPQQCHPLSPLATSPWTAVETASA